VLDRLVRLGDVAWPAAERHDELVMMRRSRGGLLPWTLLGPCLLLAAGCSPAASPSHAKPPAGTSPTRAASAAPTASARTPAAVSVTIQAAVALYRLPAPVFRTAGDDPIPDSSRKQT
jgi:hypothetical protein